MLDKIKVFAPAKLNIFLKILGKRLDGYHNIRSGIILINLFDEIQIKKNKKNNIRYIGKYKPKDNKYADCIIDKTIKFLDFKENINLDITIKKNIPVQGGLGSASTNAAALIEGLIAMQLIGENNIKKYVSLGADIPFFLAKKNCLVRGIGEILTPLDFPKYYFLIVKPNLSLSTKTMYNKLKFDKILSEENFFGEEGINEEDSGNDFESIAINESSELKKIFKFLENLDDMIFVRMSGSGSCCYAAFENIKQAHSANKNFKLFFPELWTSIAKNLY